MIAAEDTRHSMKLMTHFDIHTPLTSYHEHNKVEKAAQLVNKMIEGAEIAVITGVLPERLRYRPPAKNL